AFHLHRPNHGYQLLGARAFEPRPVPTGANNIQSGDALAHVYYSFQQASPTSLAHHPHPILCRLQIDRSQLHPTHHLAYFLFGLRRNLLCNFFFNASSSPSSCSSLTGRSSHIFSFTSTNSRVSSRNNR